MMQRVASVASNGFVRNRLTVLQGGGKRAAGAVRAEASAGRGEAEMPLFQLAPALAVAASAVPVQAGIDAAEGASALDIRPESRSAQIRAARMKGYEGDSCEECGNFTLVRNGTCLKCDTCGATSGCS
jgi:ribonucleoside-diphosphate reductase alpha chain